MEVLGIILSLALLMFFAYRGFSVILFAPVFALLAASMQGLSVMPSYTELFMGKAVTYIKSFFPVFLLGAVFGKVMEDTGLAKSIAHAIVQGLGKERAILSVVLAGLVLTYGGVSLFVVVFAVYPFACALFREADIPKRLIPGCIALGAFTITMTCIPGTPQIQNVIPANFYGTTIYAAPITGLFASVGILGLGLAWLEYRRKQAAAAGEGYGNHTLNEPEVKDYSDLPPWQLACLPLLAVLVINYIMTNMVAWDPDILKSFQAMKLPLVAPAVKNVLGIWALIIALVCGIVLAVAIGYKRLPAGGGLAKSLNAGAIGSLLAIMNTASEVGYGNVIASLPGFKAIANFLLSIKIGGTPLVSEAVTVNVLAGITGSASGGMSIALDLMAKDWLAWANSVGLSPELLHRIASIASGGLDTLPHNGAVITLLAVCGLTHKESYLDIFMVATLITVTMGFVAILFHAVTGLV
ncbi:GntP family permease [Sporolituus thermophilus]|uniref:H+/gluconate symporter n=1 Tax=Sporolituus thermophilus DSM 23256 TaxID=1123285 RepID=A0A1G7LIK4_9FIRM|nr:GntP family permease [Sporolituus thermophilus]SDF49367.1 H+/gluconate symporter [Sporolituus thermophilus DSM 23256]